MAEKEHVKILKRRVTEWNEWREQNPTLEPDLGWADLHGLNLQGANLCDANLYQCSLVHSDLTDCDLEEANLIRADLKWAILKNARLVKAHLRNANLREADLRAADLTGAWLESTDLVGVDLGVIVGLNKTIQLSPSVIGIATLEKTARSIRRKPESLGKILDFLKKAQVSRFYIDAFKKNCQRPNDHSCFISYSHTNKDFARWLNARLIAEGILTWFDQEGLLPGARITGTTTEAIQKYDRLLLCCSEASLSSHEVEDEISAAVAKEKQTGDPVIIALMIDDALTNWDGQHCHRIRERLRLDFNGWEYDIRKKFDQPFKQLLRALRPRG